jgi:hypothetical protein
MTWKGALATKSGSNQATVDGTPAAVTFDTVVYDGWGNNKAFNLNSQPTRLVIPAGVTSKVRITAGMKFSNQGGLSVGRRVYLLKNGAVFYGGTARTDFDYGQSFNLATPPLVVSPGDYFELMVLNESTLTPEPEIVGSNQSWFAVEELPSALSCAMVKMSAATHGFPASGGTNNVQFGTEEYDVGGWADLATFPTRLTVPSGVTHCRVTGSTRFSQDMWMGANDVTFCQIAPVLNSNSLIVANAASAHVPGDRASMWSAAWFQTGWIAVTPGDHFQLNLFSNHTGSHTVVQHEETFFAIEALTDADTAIADAVLGISGGGGGRGRPTVGPAVSPVVSSGLFSPILPPRSGLITRNRRY